MTDPTLLDRLAPRLLATPGDRVLGLIADPWPLRRHPLARDMLRTWVKVHRAQEVAHG